MREDQIHKILKFEDFLKVLGSFSSWIFLQVHLKSPENSLKSLIKISLSTGQLSKAPTMEKISKHRNISIFFVDTFLTCLRYYNLCSMLYFRRNMWTDLIKNAL